MYIYRNKINIFAIHLWYKAKVQFRDILLLLFIEQHQHHCNGRRNYARVKQFSHNRFTHQDHFSALLRKKYMKKVQTRYILSVWLMIVSIILYLKASL